jgi:HTH-type transcriptional regulator, sugar sensing transcriptional regulator
MKTTGKDFQEDLVSLGLTSKEASVYIALLELGRSTVSVISRKAQVNRATGYVILDSLVAKGLVHISGKEPKQEYAAESPDELVTLFRQKAEEMNAKIGKATELALKLKSLQKVGDRPQVKFYEGVEGLKQVYEDTLTSKGPIAAYATVEDIVTTLGDYYPRYYKRRSEKGIFVRGIISETPMGIERVKHNKEEVRESVFVDPVAFDFHPEINIYDNKTMIASWREKLGIIIESQEIADAMRKIFELSWVGAKQLEKERK